MQCDCLLQCCFFGGGICGFGGLCVQLLVVVIVCFLGGVVLVQLLLCYSVIGGCDCGGCSSEMIGVGYLCWIGVFLCGECGGVILGGVGLVGQCVCVFIVGFMLVCLCVGEFGQVWVGVL